MASTSPNSHYLLMEYWSNKHQSQLQVYFMTLTATFTYELMLIDRDIKWHGSCVDFVKHEASFFIIIISHSIQKSALLSINLREKDKQKIDLNLYVTRPVAFIGNFSHASSQANAIISIVKLEQDRQLVHLSRKYFLCSFGNAIFIADGLPHWRDLSFSFQVMTAGNGVSCTRRYKKV